MLSSELLFLYAHHAEEAVQFHKTILGHCTIGHCTDLGGQHHGHTKQPCSGGLLNLKQGNHITQ